MDGAASQNTGEHDDHRAAAFDANGNLLVGDDGGIYRLINPNNNDGTRRWVSVNGTLGVTEFFSVAYDSVNHIIFGACQDNSIPQQTMPGSIAWGANEDFARDGAQVGVDNISTPGASVHYSSQDHLFIFRRRTYTSPTTVTEELSALQIYVGPAYPNVTYQCNDVADDPQYRCINLVEGALTPNDPNDIGTIRFYQSWQVNAGNGRRLLLGTDYLYESSDRGYHFTSLGGIVANSSGDPMPSQPVGQVTAYAYGASTECGCVLRRHNRELWPPPLAALQRHRVSDGNRQLPDCWWLDP